MSSITYNLEEGIQKVIQSIDVLHHDIHTPFVVLVAGGSASGKTSRVAEKIHQAFQNSIIISMDNYYRGHTYMAEQKALGNELNWDQPEALDLELFYSHLSELKKGNTIMAPEYDFQTDPIYEAVKIPSAEIIIVEGLFALDDKLAELGNLNIFVDIGAHGQIMRRIFRDMQRTGEKPQDIMDYFLSTVEPMHMKYILPTKKNANIIISNAYNPEIESENSGIQELDFKIQLNQIQIGDLEDAVYKLGGSYLGEVEMSDRYFNPSDRNFSESGEEIKIRKIGPDKLLLSYMGPRKDTEVGNKRFVMRFFIDEDSYQLFKSVYENRVTELLRRRRNYFLGGVLVSFDVFSNGKMFLDCRYEEGQSIGILYELFDILGIDGNNRINEHYLKIV